MGCNCGKSKSTGRSTGSGTKVSYEVFGGDLEAPETRAALPEARSFAAEHGARVRSVVLREPAGT